MDHRHTTNQCESHRPKPTQSVPRQVFDSLYDSNQAPRTVAMAPRRPTPVFWSQNSAFAVFKDERPKLYVDTRLRPTKSGKKSSKKWPRAPRATHHKMFWNLTIAQMNSDDSDETCSNVLKELDINTVPVPTPMPFHNNSGGI
ncbi:expressed unknown protein [Seminavis robusta]|uniref:Uncharacterized protein n=1 Tax=Seminavis robusta TaxID=568900 RepID=A0A9N8HUC8_9STRA|nr:expressed unknown protein [Seminavis robusta]|eukprot:Sro1797_g298170.1 n/a (143) ;mRNA; f:8491-8919